MLAHSCRVMAQVVLRGFAQLRQSWVACVITHKLNRLELVNQHGHLEDSVSWCELMDDEYMCRVCKSTTSARNAAIILTGFYANIM